jgi:hypothetical protein
MRLHEASCQKDNGIDNTNDPIISGCTDESKLLGEGQIRAIGSSLIPTLGGGTNSTQTNRVPEHERTIPFVISLVSERGALCFIELADPVEIVRLTRDKSSPAKQVGMLGHAMHFGKESSICHGLLPGTALWK